MKMVMGKGHLFNKVDISGERLYSVKTGDQRDRQEAFRIHLPSQEKVSLKVRETKVVFTKK